MASLSFLRERPLTFDGTRLVVNRLGLPNPKFKIGDGDADKRWHRQHFPRRDSIHRLPNNKGIG